MPIEVFKKFLNIPENLAKVLYLGKAMYLKEGLKEIHI